ncbi:hypothetical protein N9V76_05635, partial [Candidatus Poseidoniales archaeon]|nr:hypothetical protein [Candidatus Poseidoniales archaeon]
FAVAMLMVKSFTMVSISCVSSKAYVLSRRRPLILSPSLSSLQHVAVLTSRMSGREGQNKESIRLEHGGRSISRSMEKSG